MKAEYAITTNDIAKEFGNRTFLKDLLLISNSENYSAYLEIAGR